VEGGSGAGEDAAEPSGLVEVVSGLPGRFHNRGLDSPVPTDQRHLQRDCRRGNDSVREVWYLVPRHPLEGIGHSAVEWGQFVRTLRIVERAD
jgi:hypothetical protein